LNVFALPNFKGTVPPKSCTRIITPIYQQVTWQSLMKLLPLAPKFLRLIHYILSQFLTPPLKKVVKGSPVPGKGCASKTWSFFSVCKNLGAQHPLGVEI